MKKQQVFITEYALSKNRSTMRDFQKKLETAVNQGYYIVPESVRIDSDDGFERCFAIGEKTIP